MIAADNSVETFAALAHPSLPHAATSGPSRAVFATGYEAVQGSKHRKPRWGAIASEDSVLGPTQRGRLTSTHQDLVRNFELTGWMVRKHLDYVTECEFHSATGDQAFDDDVEAIVEEHSQPELCDVRAKLSLDELFRLLESECVISGDILGVRTTGQQFQLLESDLIRNPETVRDADRWVHGVLLDDFERATRFCVWRRNKAGAGYEQPRQLSTEHARLFAHVGRLSQTRGVSPLAAAANRICDLYESFGYAINKAKLSQLLGFFFKSQALEGLGRTATEDGENRYSIKFDQGGIFHLEGDPGDELQLIANNTPSVEFQSFMSAMIHVSLLVLDLPFSFYDESATNFFGSRAAWLHYARSCAPKRRRHIRARKWFTDWLIGQKILSGELRPPRSANISRTAFRWVASGMPWWNPGQEIAADIKAIGAGLDTPQRICLERGRGTFEDNMRAISEALTFARSLGVQVEWDAATKAPPLFQREAISGRS